VIWAFFAGLCIEANLNPDKQRSRQKIKDFMAVLGTTQTRRANRRKKRLAV
jgi:hypothetical protein